MSAYVVSDAHINALVAWAVAKQVSYYWNGRRRDIQGDEQRIASVLYAENVRSVNARYRENETANGFRYVRKATDTKREPVAIIKACHCYSYQACETDDWQQSEAFAVVESINDMAQRNLPGYDAAEWGIR